MTDATLADRMYPGGPVNRIGASKAVGTPEAPTPAGGTEPTAGERMYGNAERPTRRQRDDSPSGEQAASPADLSAEALIGTERTAADKLYGDGGPTPDSPDGYSVALGERFDALEQQCREAGADADVTALTEGRREAAALLHELQVPSNEAAALTRKFGDWWSREDLSDDDLATQHERSMTALRESWGNEATARIDLARQVAQTAAQRLPWLQELIDGPAGNDPELVRMFAEIGLRQARRAKR